MATTTADSWQTIRDCEHLTSDIGAGLRMFVVSDELAQSAAKLATAIALQLGAINESTADDWACLVQSAEAPDVCDLPMAAEQCQMGLMMWWPGVALSGDISHVMAAHYGYCNTLLRMLRT